MTNRYVHGGGVDQPLLWYQGNGTDAASQRGLFANWQGSITAVTDATGNAIGVNGYDAYGIPNETNIGRFQYTGQIWLAELGLYYYKARIYSPTLGRFLQTDPIGYEDQYNLYAYVGNDPVNSVDPTGERCESVSKNKYNCTLDDTGDLSKKEISAANKVYTNTVNELVSDRSTKVELGSDIAFGTEVITETTAGEIADVLIESKVVYGGVSKKYNALHNSKGITLFNGAFSRGSEGLASTLTHEGAHGTQASHSLRELYPNNKAGNKIFNQQHQRSFKPTLRNIRRTRAKKRRLDGCSIRPSKGCV